MSSKMMFARPKFISATHVPLLPALRLPYTTAMQGERCNAYLYLRDVLAYLAGKRSALGQQQSQASDAQHVWEQEHSGIRQRGYLAH